MQLKILLFIQKASTSVFYWIITLFFYNNINNKYILYQCFTAYKNLIAKEFKDVIDYRTSIRTNNIDLRKDKKKKNVGF